jgi:hypothetical protein
MISFAKPHDIHLVKKRWLPTCAGPSRAPSSTEAEKQGAISRLDKRARKRCANKPLPTFLLYFRDGTAPCLMYVKLVWCCEWWCGCRWRLRTRQRALGNWFKLRLAASRSFCHVMSTHHKPRDDLMMVACVLLMNK